MIARLLRRFADDATADALQRARRERDRLRREVKDLRRANVTLQTLVDRYSASMTATAEQIQQMREGQ